MNLKIKFSVTCFVCTDNVKNYSTLFLNLVILQKLKLVVITKEIFPLNIKIPQLEITGKRLIFFILMPKNDCLHFKCQKYMMFILRNTFVTSLNWYRYKN